MAMRGLLIGVGGTGDEIITRIKSNLENSLGTIPDTIQFRLLDTEALSNRPNSKVKPHEFLHLTDVPSGAFYKKASDLAAGIVPAAEWSWFDAKAVKANLSQGDFNIEKGAKKFRQFGRAATFLNKTQILNMFNLALTKCRQGANGAEVPIWIIGSIAGGSGAGMLLDIAALARSQAGTNPRIIGAFVLPEVYSDVVEVRENYGQSHAVLRELQRFQAPVAPEYDGRRNGEFRFGIRYDGLTEVQLPSVLFENLIFYNAKCENNPQRASYFAQIADAFNLVLDESVGNGILSTWINVVEGKVASFNSYRIYIPVALYLRGFIAEEKLNVLNHFLPRRDDKTLDTGSDNDRLGELDAWMAIWPLFLRLNVDLEREPQRQEGISREFQPHAIVKDYFGFHNGRHRDRQTEPAIYNAAQNLCADIFASIETITQSRESVDDAKTSVKKSVDRKYNTYQGDGSGSYISSAAIIKQALEQEINTILVELINGYLGTTQTGGNSLVYLLRLLQLLKDRLNGQVISTLNKVTTGSDKTDSDKLALLKAKSECETAFIKMDEYQSSLFGGKAKFDALQNDFLSKKRDVVRLEQRIALTELLTQLKELATSKITEWQNTIKTWTDELAEQVSICTIEKQTVHEQLVYSQQIVTASMGVSNTPEMDGYQDYLRGLCRKSVDSAHPFISTLIAELHWRVVNNGIELSTYNQNAFKAQLQQQISTHISQRMQEFEGMGRYLDWLIKKVGVVAYDQLVGKLVNVRQNFIDPAPQNTPDHLLLYGDHWQPEWGVDAFQTIFTKFQGIEPNFNNIKDNLRDAEGNALFRDKNVLSVLMSTKEIPLYDCPLAIATALKKAYQADRANPNLSWRTLAQHVFRCDLEAWAIERNKVFEAGRKIDYPYLPDAYIRLLDNPEQVRLFAKALAVGIIRRDTDLEYGKFWICASPDNQQIIYLTDPKPEIPIPAGKADNLLRAFVTFVLDQTDRRENIGYPLEIDTVKNWVSIKIREEFAASKQDLANMVQTFRDENPDIMSFDPQDLHSDVESPQRRQAFMAIILDYYLRF